ncbi:MAG: glutamate--tRNA ligase family protein, partial [Candidatus Daviesbacteria bacterium]|nr:glutamate--tRNA ligase family protein [Candidatus Daviesbacteria bacterium]
MNQVRTRFAPSPTGMMHIGNVRTALYAYLTAKHSNAEFILRIEDTDRERFIEGATEEIIETLKWLGLAWDEGPIYQSQRLEIYKKHAEELIEKGLAYQKDGAIWFKIPEKGETSWIDVVGNKKITIENSTQKDFVMIKSDGYPTYNFAVVIDDHLMKISPIVRGVEFISSTPKHIMVYEAFKWEIPRFAHLPLFLGSDRSKLSKRHGAQAASEFRKDGFLHEAILNYLALLSWTPSFEKEILSLEEMVKEFSLDKVHITNAVFDITKLEWMNGI